MEEFQIGQLTKELVAIRLKKMTDPCAAAADLVKKTLAVTLQNTPPEHAAKVISDGCQGGITGLLLADQNLSKGAVLILEAVAELAAEHHVDPQEALKAALRGICDMRRFVRPDQLTEIQNEIEAHFDGAGQAFVDALTESRKADKSAVS